MTIFIGHMISFVVINIAPDLTLSFKNPSYLVNEQEETLEVCLQLNVASSQNITVLLSDVPTSASRGNMPSSFRPISWESPSGAASNVCFFVFFLQMMIMLLVLFHQALSFMPEIPRSASQWTLLMMMSMSHPRKALRLQLGFQEVRDRMQRLL